MVITSPAEREVLTGTFCVHGFQFRLLTDLCDVQKLFTRLYGNFVVADSTGPSLEAVVQADGIGGAAWRFGGQPDADSTLSGALWKLEASLCEAIIRFQRRSFAIHAATAIAGSMVMLAGSSHAGKTTLSLALSSRGFRVMGDDVALVDPDTLGVLPIPRCFHLDEPATELLRNDGFKFPESWQRFRFLTPADLQVSKAAAGPERRWIFMHGPRAAHPEIAPVSKAEMTARLLSETGRGPLNDSEILAVICRLVSRSSCYLLTPGPLSETADMLAAKFSAAG